MTSSKSSRVSTNTKEVKKIVNKHVTKERKGFINIEKDSNELSKESRKEEEEEEEDKEKTSIDKPLKQPTKRSKNESIVHESIKNKTSLYNNTMDENVNETFERTLGYIFENIVPPPFYGSNDPYVIYQFISDFRKHCDIIYNNYGKLFNMEVNITLKGHALDWWLTDVPLDDDMNIDKFCDLVKKKFLPADSSVILAEKFLNFKPDCNNVRKSLNDKLNLLATITRDLTPEQILTVAFYILNSPSNTAKYFNEPKDLHDFLTYIIAFEKNCSAPPPVSRKPREYWILRHC
ncbi:hypothetical protein B5S29_g5772 [[Candida] boidinii]|uniref:Unnamed protein product n=1 Tax=Candida boidinii TaxID=5477 RepID=A0ACB5TTV0_CANBO|nr:hypothetical protein B5S29_g5772 [[Candida] boidinii]GME93721.1 unnamed protein product [[Candida] boidinii]